MAETKFTPGPFEVRIGGNFVDIWAGGQDYAKVGLPSRFKVGEANYRQSDDGSNTPESAEANGHLMAASPDLYAALDAIQFSGHHQRCPVCKGSRFTGHGALCDVGRSLAKARGEA